MTVNEFKDLFEEADGDADIVFMLPTSGRFEGVESIIQTKRIDIEGARCEVVVTLKEKDQ